MILWTKSLKLKDKNSQIQNVQKKLVRNIALLSLIYMYLIISIMVEPCEPLQNFFLSFYSSITRQANMVSE